MNSVRKSTCTLRTVQLEWGGTNDAIRCDTVRIVRYDMYVNPTQLGMIQNCYYGEILIEWYYWYGATRVSQGLLYRIVLTILYRAVFNVPYSLQQYCGAASYRIYRQVLNVPCDTILSELYRTVLKYSTVSHSTHYIETHITV